MDAVSIGVVGYFDKPQWLEVSVYGAGGYFHQPGAFGDWVDASDVVVEVGEVVFGSDVWSVGSFGDSAGGVFTAPSGACVSFPIFLHFPSA